MYWIFSGVLVVGLVIGLLFWLLKPIRYQNEPAGNFEHYIRVFFGNLDDGGLIFITHEPTKKFVQYAKYVSSERSVLHYGFPDATWSSSYFAPVYQALNRAGIDAKILETKVEEVSRFIEIDIDLQQKGAFEVAAQIACITFDAMNVDSHNELFSITWKGPLSTNTPGIDPEIETKALEKLERHRFGIVRKWARRRAERLSKQVR